MNAILSQVAPGQWSEGFDFAGHFFAQRRGVGQSAALQQFKKHVTLGATFAGGHYARLHRLGQTWFIAPIVIATQARETA